MKELIKKQIAAMVKHGATNKKIKKVTGISITEIKRIRWETNYKQKGKILGFKISDTSIACGEINRKRKYEKQKAIEKEYNYNNYYKIDINIKPSRLKKIK